MRDYPHHVETVVPKPLGLENRLNEIYVWHRARAIDVHQGSSRMVEQDREFYEYVRWCFVDADTADAFAAEFGGIRASSRSRPQPR